MTTALDAPDDSLQRGFYVKKYRFLVAVETSGVAHSIIDVFRRVHSGLRIHIACGRELFLDDVEAFDATRSTTCIPCLVAKFPWEPL